MACQGASISSSVESRRGLIVDTECPAEIDRCEKQIAHLVLEPEINAARRGSGFWHETAVVDPGGGCQKKEDDVSDRD